MLVLDARDLYDAVAENESATCACDRRSAMEALALKQALSWGNTAPRLGTFTGAAWVSALGTTMIVVPP